MAVKAILFNIIIHLKQRYILFFIIFISLQIPIKCYQFFKAFNTLTNDIIILCEDGIIKYDPESETQKLIESYNIIKGIGNVEFLSISQFPLNNGGYILCRIQNYIYLLSQDANESYGFVYVPNIYNTYAELRYYINEENQKSFIIAYIMELKFNLLMYEINFPSFNETQLSFQKAHDIIYDNIIISSFIISCEIMNSSNKKNLLNCFVTNERNSIISLIFDQDNNFTLLNKFSNLTETSRISIITQNLSPDREKALVCYITGEAYLKCFIYNLEIENKKWNQSLKLIDNCLKNHNSKEPIYNNDKKEYLIYCYSPNNEISLIKLDQVFNIKYIDDQKCTILLRTDNYYTIISLSLFYDKYKEKYCLASYGECGNNYDKFRISSFDDNCNDILYESHLIDDKFSTLPLTSFPIYSSKPSVKTDLISTYIETSTLSNQNVPIISSQMTFSSKPSNQFVTSTLPNLFNHASSNPLNTSFPILTTSLQTSRPSIVIISSIYSISSIPIIQNTSHIPLNSYISKTTILTPSFINNTNNINFNIKDINFYEKGDILKGKINKTKEEIEKNLDDIIDQIEIGKRYEINGKDYNILISPVEDIDTFQSTHIEFSICEQILRKEYNISSDEILTILQIDFNKMNEKSLTNQVEYEIYNEKRKKLNLTYCKDIQIKVIYKIEEESLINKSMISYYSDIGIDIYDRNDSFFNDICYSNSEFDSDIILKDRVLDIYQNYSLCDNECTYDQIDIETMSVTCSCQVKTEINFEVSEPVFGKMVEETFKNSNFGVILCYKLVFDFKNKGKNIGFWIFLIFVSIHILCFIYYLIYNIKSVKIFVYKEMLKYNYLINISRINASPIKRKNIKKSVLFSKKNLNKENNNIEESKKSELRSSFSKNRILNENQPKIDSLFKRDKQRFKTEKKKNIKINNPILIFKYNYYNMNKSKNDSVKSLIRKNKKKLTKQNKKNKEENNKLRYKLPESNEDDKKCPGYYTFIQMNANNDKNNEPPESKYILNNYDYENAIKYDNRDFWRIYYIFLLYKEKIIKKFFFIAPLEIQPLRLSIFIFNYSCDFALNALFYLNQNISDKYHYEGEYLYWFTLVNNLTISIFSTLFSFLLIKALSQLINSKESLENLFRQHEKIMRKKKNYKVSSENKKIIYENIIKIFKNLKIKIICYIIIEFILLLFFFYYITAFCEVYKNTQISWISDSFISFLLSIPLELLISFFLSLLYMVSLKYKFEKLYNFVLFFYKIG